jgi:DNA-binding PadR family transcriptional regulator
MRITLATALVLQAISRGHQHGFEIVEMTGFPTGTVYPALRRLEHAGYVCSEWEAERTAFRDARPQRRYYEITAAGRRELDAAIDRLHVLGALRPRTAR